MIHCRLYIARKSFEKLSPELHTINILRQSVSQSETRVVILREVDTRSPHFPAHDAVYSVSRLCIPSP